MEQSCDAKNKFKYLCLKNGVGATVYPHAKEWSWTITSSHTHTKMGQRPKYKNLKYENIRKIWAHKLIWPWIFQLLFYVIPKMQETRKKMDECTSSKLNMFVHWMTVSKQWKEGL